MGAISQMYGGRGAIWGRTSEGVHDLEGVCLLAVMAVARQRGHLSALAELVVWGDSLYLNRICCITADDGRTIAKQVNMRHLGTSIYPAAKGAHSSSCVGLVHFLCHGTVLIFNSNPVNQVVLSC